MPLNQKEGLILLFVVFILFTMDNSNNDDKRSELCVEVKQKFGEMESIFDACIGVSEGMDACIECKEGYLNLQQSFIKLKSLMKNSTCADISYEQNSINKDEKTWLKLGCSHAGEAKSVQNRLLNTAAQIYDAFGMTGLLIGIIVLYFATDIVSRQIQAYRVGNVNHRLHVHAD